ncbi:hypothetical protein D0Y65_045305 [Glycine soja]|uniref:Uncharacterized protein n=1 Tax=Glycine soja TaxID=3848 RepID=A0A445G477_GLYSO|nr:hypothetical protein D0Y65_045305 [Glycine soja]
MMQTEAPSSPSFSFHNNSSESFPHVDDDFEFSFVPRHTDSSPVSADDIFYNGQIRPIYPLFHQNAVVHASATTETAPHEPRRRRLPLRTLMFEEEEERETVKIDSSNELYGVAEGTYCVWTPPCKKVSKRWKIRDFLLPRSHSDGKRTSKVAPKYSSTAVNGGASAKLGTYTLNQSRGSL